MSDRDVTLSTIQKMLDAGMDALGSEPVGVVLLYPNQAFLKAVWIKEANRSDVAIGLMDAATDEMSKA